ncbi:a1-alpha2 repression [Podila epigama]|nr:a1-alpha2 repression [Podila epigama]
MDNDTLKRLFKAGAILLVLDAPQNQLEFGIDVNCWNTGPKFKGIKIIPPGAHFVYYSLHTSKDKPTEPQDDSKTIEVAEGGPSGGDVRIGFWHVFASGEVVVMKWNAYNEEMELETDQEQIARYKAGIQEFDPFLGAYPLLPPESTYPAWVKISNHIQQNTVSRIFFNHGFVNAHDDQLEDELSRASKLIQREQDKEAQEKAKQDHSSHQGQAGRTTTSFKEEEEEEEEEKVEMMETEQTDPAPKKTVQPPTRLPAKKQELVAFTTINLRSSFRKGAVGEEVTRYSIDKSWLLNNLFTTVYKSDVSNFLGEYQAAFVTMLLSYHLGAFRQWKAMTILICQSNEALSSSNYTGLFGGFIQTLEAQLSSIPSSFFMDLLFASSDESEITASFLEQALKTLGRNVHAALRRGECAELRRPMRHLQKAVLESFEWKITGDFKASSKIVEIREVDMDRSIYQGIDDDDDDYVEEGEYAPVIVE